METGRIINTLYNNVLAYFQTIGCEKLLNRENLKTVWNMKQSGTNVFPDDLAIAKTIIKPEFDNCGRMILANDTVIIRFTPQELLTNVFNPEFISKIQDFQNKNGLELKNPLPQVTL